MTVVVVDDDPPIEFQAVLGQEAIKYLKHHWIKAILHHARVRDSDVGATLPRHDGWKPT